MLVSSFPSGYLPSSISIYEYGIISLLYILICDNMLIGYTIMDNYYMYKL